MKTLAYYLLGIFSLCLLNAICASIDATYYLHIQNMTVSAS